MMLWMVCSLPELDLINLGAFLFSFTRLSSMRSALTFTSVRIIYNVRFICKVFSYTLRRSWCISLWADVVISIALRDLFSDGDGGGDDDDNSGRIDDDDDSDNNNNIIQDLSCALSLILL